MAKKIKILLSCGHSLFEVTERELEVFKNNGGWCPTCGATAIVKVAIKKANKRGKNEKTPRRFDCNESET